ncbi:MAG TPA: hypothetical protein DIC41_08430, partial [Alphaproteobacteria bacterium]|nr:hypothetical protein [Alphaproteobacteria bacterium]
MLRPGRFATREYARRTVARHRVPFLDCRNDSVRSFIRFLSQPLQWRDRMSRLDEAETRFAEAMKALETALERRLAAASNSEAEDSGAGDR